MDPDEKAPRKMEIPSSFGHDDTPIVPVLKTKIVHGITCYWSDLLMGYVSNLKQCEHALHKALNENIVVKPHVPKKRKRAYLFSDTNVEAKKGVKRCPTNTAARAA